MGLDTVLDRDHHRHIAETYTESEDWEQGSRQQPYFDGDADAIDELTGDASASWAEILDLDRTQVTADRYPLQLDAHKPGLLGYPVKMSFGIHDAPQYPGIIQHTVFLLDADDYRATFDEDRRHVVSFLNATDEQYLNAAQAVQESVEGELRRMRFAGEEIIGGDRVLEYSERQ